MLRRLFQSHQRRDDQAFNYIARQIVEEEREKHHHLLAQDLADILDGASRNPARRGETVQIPTLEDLPRDSERGSTLVEVRRPTRGLQDIVLSPDNQAGVSEVVREFRKSDVLKTYNLVPTNHLLFCGPPGCGKTLCAEVLAYELEMPILYARFDAIVSSYLGETAANLRRVFEYASRGQWLLFFDEFDAIGKSRDDPLEHGELKRVVNTFLQLLDGFHSNGLVVAATNHETTLDSALWRRFDEVLYFSRPDKKQIMCFLDIKLRSVRHSRVKWPRFAQSFVGMSYSDIGRICEDAMKLTVLAGERELDQDVLSQAVERHKKRLSIADSIHRDIVSQDADGDV